jgi:predicted transcriptional regulator
MPTQQPPRPTDAELEILQVLWSRGPATVRTVHEDIAASRSSKPTRYTTVLKLMQNMVAKRLLMRDEQNRSHIYYPLVRREDTEKRLLGEFRQRVFQGSTQKLVLQALSSEKATPEDLSEIRRLLDELEKKS